MSHILGTAQAKEQETPKISMVAHFNEFENELNDMLSIIVDKYNKADKQNIVIEVLENGRIETCGSSFLKGRMVSNLVLWDATTAQVLDATTYTGGFQQVALPIKMIIDILSRFKGLRRTVATMLQLDMYERHCEVTVYEESIKKEVVDEESFDFIEQDEEVEEDVYAQKSKFSISLANINPQVKHELAELQFVDNPVMYQSKALQIYLDLLYPQIAEEVTETTDAIVFLEDNIYVRTISHLLSIRNGLVKSEVIPCMKNVKLNKVVANFLMGVLNKHEEFYITMEERPNHAILMTLQVEGMVVTRLIPQVTNPIRLEDYFLELGNRFEVDKVFLDDALRRVTVGNNLALMEFTVTDGVPELRLSNKASNEEYATQVPVLNYEGSGENFAFRLLPKFIAGMATTYMSNPKYEDIFPDRITFQVDYVQPTNGRGEPTISLGVSDAKGLWSSIKVNLKQGR